MDRDGFGSDGGDMPVRVSFEVVRAATLAGAEDARLVWAQERLVALLVPAEVGWFLEIGLGPCEGEGVLFPTIAAAEHWVRERIPSCWPAPQPPC